MQDCRNIFRGVTYIVWWRLLSNACCRSVCAHPRRQYILLFLDRYSVVRNSLIPTYLPISRGNVSPTTVREIPQGTAGMCTRVCILGALNVRLLHSEVFTVNKSNKRKYAPQSDCNNREEITIIYITTK